MISIKKNEIQSLLIDHQTSNTERLPVIMVALDNFIKNIPHDNPLTPEELYTLTILTLNHQAQNDLHSVEAQLREKLTQGIEALFEKSRMDCFRACLVSNELNQDIFNLICDTDNLETLPKKPESVRPWLENNHLPYLSEKAFTQLIKINQLTPNLSNKTISNLSLVSQSFHGLFKPTLDKHLDQLGQCIINLELTHAKEMIRANPGLLRIPLTITDHSNRKIQGTALQLALGSEAIKFYNYEVAMVDMIIRELKKQPNGEHIIAKQICDQFPEGYDAKHQARIDRDQAAVDAFFAALHDSDNVDNWEAAADTYRKHFDNENLGKGVINTGYHCNKKSADAFFNAYNQNYGAFGDFWGTPKNLFAWQKGKYCLRYVTITHMMELTRVDLTGFSFTPDSTLKTLPIKISEACTKIMIEKNIRLFKNKSEEKHNRCEALIKSVTQPMKKTTPLDVACLNQSATGRKN